MQILLIDNYDSFTWNLVHLLGSVGCTARVVRNDAITVAAILESPPEAIVISPGPCSPDQAGICCDMIEKTHREIPIFGVCLGLQCIGQVFGGDITRAPVPRHGKTSTIHHQGKGVFRGLNSSFSATRYHSLVVARNTCPSALAVTAETDEGLIMGLSHKDLPTHGVQFHPESILSEHGATIAKSFLDLAAEWNIHHRKRTTN
jgi:anthranilate synthase component II